MVKLQKVFDIIFCIAYIMVADDLAMQGAKASAAMV